MPSIGTTGRPAYVYDQETDTFVPVGVGPHTHDNFVLATLIDAKGDLLVGQSPDTVNRLPVGTNGFFLSADSSEALGLKWAQVFPSQTGNAGEFLVTDGTLASWSNTIQANAIAAVGLIVKGTSGQTADILQIQNSSSANLFTVNAGGNIGIGPIVAGSFNKGLSINSEAGQYAGILFVNNSTGTTSDDGTAVYISNSEFVISNRESAGITLSTNGAVRMNITGVGTTVLNQLIESTYLDTYAWNGTVNFNILDLKSVYYTTSNSTSNWTLNLRGSAAITLNSIMSNGQSLTFSNLITNGPTAYYQTGFQIDGVARTVRWQDGFTPTSGNANSIDVYTVTVIKTGNDAFTVLASQTRFA